MSNRQVLAVIASTAVLVGPLAASAQDDEEPPEPQPLAAEVAQPPLPPPPSGHTITLDAQLGLGTSGAGVGLEYSPTPALALSASLGASFDGTQVGAMARLRLPGAGGSSWGLGLGYSEGPLVWHELDLDTSVAIEWHLARRLDVEISTESRHGDLRFRAAAGLARVLNPEDGACVEYEIEHCEEDHLGDPLVLPYVVLTLGWVLDL